MPRIKIKRTAPSVDMTAMSDVTFLLLNFFVMTAVFKTPEPIPIDVPASVVTEKMPDENFAMITVSNDGKCLLSFAERDVKQQTLDIMIEKYNIRLTPEEKEKFLALETLGVPIRQLKQFLSLSTDKYLDKSFNPGIAVDTTTNMSNELFNWISTARKVNYGLHDNQLKILIKADGNVKFPAVSQVIETLRNQKANKFSFITSLKSEA
ncbi:biopolymer transporter ExbD [Sphingobacterium puteale]|uniref:Biopolymer transporter ExbD n=1 Tax=Sphingobacterium puteale TaxID=2420510 RepID=A0A420VSF1_9SPHI|nr:MULTISPECIES: biopolymer transporter ExbD [Sphingobacterium]QIH34768.1 biopolymer transporter ExbD [Sphingobacterium sp. DR205]RKO69205.1 biopolymer transporter ExbD [Sphingobacterium puteale]